MTGSNGELRRARLQRQGPRTPRASGRNTLPLLHPDREGHPSSYLRGIPLSVGQRRSSGDGGGSSGGTGGESSGGTRADVRGDGDGHRVVITEQPTAEMLFPAGDKKEADYHKNTNSDVLMKWLKCRLWPAFRETYGDRKMILILDNTPYHHGMADDWESPLKATKAVNAARLRDLGLKTISIQRGGVRKDFAVPKEGAEFARAPRGPSLDEVQAETLRMVK